MEDKTDYYPQLRWRIAIYGAFAVAGWNRPKNAIERTARSGNQLAGKKNNNGNPPGNCEVRADPTRLHTGTNNKRNAPMGAFTPKNGDREVNRVWVNCYGLPKKIYIT
jgi:hypothetical protein